MTEPRRHAFGLPDVAFRVWRSTLPSQLLGVVIFLILALGCLAAFLPTGWGAARVGGVVLGLFAVLAFVDFVRDARQLFGLRIVPRFERPLPDAGTYLHGHSLLRACPRLDEVARREGEVALSELGMDESLRPDSNRWIEPSIGRSTISCLLQFPQDTERTVKDLQRIDLALAKAETHGIRFRLVVVAGTGMNSMLWEQLQKDGY